MEDTLEKDCGQNSSQQIAGNSRGTFSYSKAIDVRETLEYSEQVLITK